MSKIRTRKRGKTYSYVFEAGRTFEGKRKVIEKGGFGTAAQAYDAGVAAYNKFKYGGIELTGNDMLLCDYLKSWLRIVSHDLRSSTIASYQAAARQINKKMGGKKIKEIRPRDIDTLYRKLANEGYSLNTIRSVRSTLHNALRYAVYPAELLFSNPVDGIQLPRKAAKEVIKRKIITPESLTRLLTKYPYNTPYHIPILLLYHTGMRIGEVLGLTWENIDVKRGIIHVAQQLRYNVIDREYICPPKTDTSVRSILLDSELLNTLRRWQQTQKDNEKTYGNSYVYVYQNEKSQLQQASKDVHITGFKSQINLVCTAPNGHHITYQSISAILKKSEMNAHSFRHTHATMLIEQNATPKGVAERLGHKNVNLTENLYTHSTRKIAQDTLAIFEKIVQGNADN